MILKVSNLFTYDINDISNDCYDLYVSDDGGYTWEYYSSYGTRAEAVFAGNAAVEYALDRANNRDK
jgi:hypothetical protein